MATIGTRLFTFFNGIYVGKDEFGNKYYRGKKKNHGVQIGRPGTERRWVVYKGLAEPSKIPPSWHGWMHYMTDEVPDEKDMQKTYLWEKEHLPNLTGTDNAYRPPGHVLKGGKRDKATGDYESWRPE